jgi:hypothetical protein
MKLPNIFKTSNAPSGEPTVHIKTSRGEANLFVEAFDITRRGGGGRGRGGGRGGGGRKVISTSLFIFPQRAKTLTDYKDRVDEFMSGLEKGVRGIGAYPEWEYLLYVDYSVYKTYSDKAVMDITAMVQTRLADLVERYASLNVSGVRYVATGSSAEAPTNFLPSVWRFLPMIDPAVDLFTSVDLDNPPSPLILQTGERWYNDPATAASGSNRLFIVIDHYYPMQCVLYMSKYLDIDETADPKNDVHCPIAQFWFWKKHDSGRKWFGDMMTMMYDEEFDVFFDPPLPWIFDDFKSVAVRTPRFKAMLAAADASPPHGGADATTHTVRVKDLQAVVRDALDVVLADAGGSFPRCVLPALESKARAACSARIAAWARKVRDSTMLTQVLAMTVFGRAMEDAKNGVSTMMANAFVSPGLFREMNTLITDAGYGIDEYVMNLLMNPPRRNYPMADTASPPPTIYTPFSLEVGFKRAPPMKAIVLQNRGVPATVRLLGASIKGDCPTQTANMYGKLRNTEYLVRAAILIMFLHPEPGSSQEAHAWFSAVSGHYKARAGYLSDNADIVAHLLATENRFIRAMMFKVVDIDRTRFTQVWSRVGIVYSNDRLIYKTNNIKHMEQLKDAAVRQIFLQWHIVTMMSCIDAEHVEAFNAIPW